MIPRTEPAWQSQTWQEQLINVVRDPVTLCRLLDLDPQAFMATHGASITHQTDQAASSLIPTRSLAQAASEDFPLRVPHSFIARMKPRDLQDPLLLQVLPQAQEMLDVAGYEVDPLHEADAIKSPGIIQKYHGRALLTVTSACAIHCRYCFRRHFPYADHRQSRSEWSQALQSIAKDPSIREVIFSGGDPLSAPDHYLASLVDEIQAIPHVTTLRIHTRLPVVIPHRIDTACLDWLTQTRLNTVMVIHSNHSNEIDQSVVAVLASLKAIGVTLLNQSVLLKDINDKAETLIELSETLFNAGVLPYYLHVLDKVKSTHHFDLAEAAAKRIHQQVRARLPGYLVPHLTREIPGEPNKIILG